MARIGIYGGSFNPVHNGHVLAAKELIRLLDLDTLYLIPAALPPHKPLPQNTPSAQDRMELLQLAMQDVPNTQVSDIEIARQGKSYSVDTVSAIRAQHPDDSLYLLMGSDMLLSFEAWKDYEKLFQLATLGVMCRFERSAREFDAISACADAFRAKYGARIELLENQRIEISSTTVRRMLLLGCGESFLPDAVYARIREKKLYGVGADLKGLSFKDLTDAVMPLYEPRRAAHAIGCAEAAEALAKQYGADPVLAARAGILHDITKALGAREQLLLCEKYGILSAEYDGCQRKLLHGKTAAAAAKAIFGECDAVCEAISWHTTGKADMTTLEKIIYLADYIEPTRDFDGVEHMRSLAEKKLDDAVLYGMEETIRILREQGRPLNCYTVQARDFLIQERNIDETGQ